MLRVKKTMCARCGVKPRRHNSSYCSECAVEMTRQWKQRRKAEFGEAEGYTPLSNEYARWREIRTKEYNKWVIWAKKNKIREIVERMQGGKGGNV